MVPWWVWLGGVGRWVGWVGGWGGVGGGGACRGWWWWWWWCVDVGVGKSNMFPAPCCVLGVFGQELHRARVAGESAAAADRTATVASLAAQLATATASVTEHVERAAGAEALVKALTTRLEAAEVGWEEGGGGAAVVPRQY
jgi:hypothetical protein